VFVGDKTKWRQNPRKSTQSSPPSPKRVSSRVRRTGSPTCTNAGDLTGSDCHSCVERILDMLGRLCGDAAVATRVQLSGCYLRYEVVGFK